MKSNDPTVLWLKELFYRHEIEIFRVGNSNEYGLREVLRSRFKTPDGVSGWRKYSDRKGGSFTMTYEQMKKLLGEAEHFVRKMK